MTTNHIAAAAGVSPGNLYYWFRNKSEIVRALFEIWRDESALPAISPREPSERVAMLFSSVYAQIEVTGRFAVFSRELVPLLHADEKLAEMYRDNYVHRVDTLTLIVEGLVESGHLTAPPQPATLRDLVQSTWITTEYAPSFIAAISAGREADDPDAHADAVAAIIRAPLVAQLTPLGLAALSSVTTV